MNKEEGGKLLDKKLCKNTYLCCIFLKTFYYYCEPLLLQVWGRRRNASAANRVKTLLILCQQESKVLVLILFHFDIKVNA